MGREFRILGNVFAVESSRTSESFVFDILSRMIDLPNVTTHAGHITIHFPCQGVPRFHATIILDPTELEIEGDPVPTFDDLRDIVLREFKIDVSESWAIDYYEVTDGQSDNNYSYSS